MSSFHTFNKNVGSPKVVFSPPRPVATKLAKKKVSNSRVLQELVDLLQGTNSSTFKNREEYAREFLQEKA